MSPGDKGLRYPPDPPTVEEIIAVMRTARGNGLEDVRLRGVIVVLWRAGLRISEALELNESDLDADRGALLVRHGKGDKPRRQPLAPQLAAELRQLQQQLCPSGAEPVFCGLAGGRLQPKVLAAIIKRAAERAGLDKRVTAHTLRHTAATWLRQETGDTRLVAEYLGHADLSTVSRYAHVAEREIYEATAALGRLASAEVAEVHERRAA
jgi:site-specific recombinase XerD